MANMYWKHFQIFKILGDGQEHWSIVIHGAIWFIAVSQSSQRNVTELIGNT